MNSNCVYVRKLLWDDVRAYINQTELEELESILGSSLLRGNKELHKELIALQEILNDYQQQNDALRQVLQEHQRQQQIISGGSSRALLVERLKLLVTEFREKPMRKQLPERDERAISYVLSAAQQSCTANRDCIQQSLCENQVQPYSARSYSSQRPISRGSTISITSESGLQVSLERIRKRLNIDEVDAIKDELHDALESEHQELIEDIEFMQSCLEMENELISDDQKKINNAGISGLPPSNAELQAINQSLSTSIYEHDETKRINRVFSNADNATSSVNRRKVQPLEASAMISSQYHNSLDQYQAAMHLPFLQSQLYEPSSLIKTNVEQITIRPLKIQKKVNQIRAAVQHVRDESFMLE